MLFAEAFDKTRRRLWVLRHAAASTTTWCFQASPFRCAAGKFKTVPSATLNNLVELMEDA